MNGKVLENVEWGKRRYGYDQIAFIKNF